MVVYGNGWIELLYRIYENLFSYLVIVSCCIFVYLILFRKFLFDLFDPFLHYILFSALATSVPLFMYQEKMFHSVNDFYAFLFTEIAFIVGIMISYRYATITGKTKGIIKLVTFPPRFLSWIYYFYFLIFAITKLAEYYFVGIPLFAPGNRMELYHGGFGYFYWLNFAVLYPLLFFTVHTYFAQIGSQCIRKIIIVFILITLGLSDTKASVLSIIHILFFYKLYLLKQGRSDIVLQYFTKWYYRIFIISIVFAFIPIIFKTAKGDLLEAVLQFLMRLVGYGDIFAYFYADNFNDSIEMLDFFSSTIGSVLAMFKIIDYSQVPVALGRQITSIVYGNEEIFAGPNARHNIFGVIYFGIVGGVLYSFVIGIINGYVCRYCYHTMRSINVLTFLLYSYVYLNVTIVSTDLSLAFNPLIMFLLINFALLTVALAFYLSIYKQLSYTTEFINTEDVEKEHSLV